MGTNLPNSNSSITYKISVTNFGNVEMGIYTINNLPSNLEYELSGYTLKDKICVNNQCSLGITKEFYITIKYKDGGYNASNTTYPLSLDIDFRSFHTVTYEEFTSTSSYPKEVIDGGDLIVNFTQRVPDVEIKIGNVSLNSNSYTFDSEQRYLYIPEGNITDDVTITFIADPPTITFALVDNSVINSNGWAKENFYVEATIVDNSGKGIASASSCATTSSTCTPNASFTGNTKNFYITTEGSNVACVTATSNNGKSTTVCSDPYKLDKTAPTAGTATFTGTLGSNDWYTTNVTVNVRNGSDSLSGHSTTVSNVSSITSNTTGTTVRITTTDLAGNSSTRDYTIKVDKNSPTFTSGPAVDTVEVYLNDSNVISNWFGVSYSTSGGSVSCTPGNTNYFDLLGTYTATCTATGGNGKTASVTQSVKVLSNGLYEIFIKDAVADNTSSTYVSSSSGIDFNSPASITNGQGVYRASSITSDPIYYYRGNVSNNNVIYANYCWKMVITTADRGVKLIYNGVPSNGSCTRTGTNTQIGTSAFNSIQTDNAYIGYMYGAPETSTIYGDVNDNGSVTATDYLLLKRFVICAQDYVIGDVNGDGRLTNADYLLLNRFINGTQTPTEEQELLGDVNLDGSLTASDYIIVKNYVLNNINSIIDQNSDISRYNATHKNRNNSTIKSAIDSWYSMNMTGYTSDLEDAIWCNDRSKSSSYLDMVTGPHIIQLIIEVHQV